MAEGTDIRSAGNGVLEARAPDGSASMMYSAAHYEEPGAAHETVSASDGSQWYSMAAHAEPPQPLPDGGSGYDAPRNEAAAAYNNAQFQSFMPAYEQQITQVNADRAQDGVMEVRHADGSGTTFYDQSQYQAPRGEHQVYEDAKGGQWYAIPGKPAVERVPVYEDGKPAYDGDKLRTVQQETIRYKAVPQRHAEPSKRNQHERKPPRRKQ
jgi:putative component of toxin-antitoxin plasmid stabilization module